MTIARDLGVAVHETDLHRTDLYTADEVFVCGTAAEITPVREIDDRAIGAGEPGPLTKKIHEIFHAAVRGEVEQYASWLEHV
jgi:branched-chain amino acid aminotransferase